MEHDVTRVRSTPRSTLFKIIF